MEKTRADILIEKSKTNYDSAVKIIADVYDNVFSKDGTFRYDKRYLLAEYDKYLQAVLIKLCVPDRFKPDEMRFIENISDYGKLVEGTDYTLFADCVKDMSDRLVSRAEEQLKEVPVCFKLVGAVDSGKNSGLTKLLLDYTIKIAFNLKLIDPSANVKDNSDVVGALRSVYAFARGNGINLK